MRKEKRRERCRGQEGEGKLKKREREREREREGGKDGGKDGGREGGKERGGGELLVPSESTQHVVILSCKSRLGSSCLREGNKIFHNFHLLYILTYILKIVSGRQEG